MKEERKNLFYSQSNLYKEGRGLFLAEKLLNKLKDILENFLPSVDAILNSNDNQYVILRSILAFFLGTLYSILLFYFSIYRIELDSSIKTVTFSMMVAIISISMSCLVKFRCAMTLVLVNFVSSSGKIMLTSYILIGILNGPIVNTFDNVNELGNSVMCQYNLFKNMSSVSKSKFKAHSEFIKSIFEIDKKVREDKKELTNLMDGFNTEFSTNEHFGNDAKILALNKDYDLEPNQQQETNTHNDDTFYYEKNLKRCMEILKQGEKGCIRNMNIMLKHCDEDFCKDQNNTCGYRHLKNNTSNANECNKSIQEEHYRGVGKNTQQLKRLSEDFDESFNFSLNYKLNLNEDVSYGKNRLVEMKTSADELKGKAIKYFRNIELFVKFLNVIANYGFSLVFLKSYKYQFSYLNDISHDNIYLTQYFRHIDARRFRLNKRVLLPLKKLEKKNLIYPFQLYIFNYLRPNVKIKLFLNLLLIAAVGITLLIDYILYDFMSLMNEHMIVNYAIESYNKFSMNVKGDGFVAKLFKLVIKNVYKENYMKMVDSSARCAPKIKELNLDKLKALLIQLGLFLTIILVEVYIKRLNRCVCAFFYRKQEKKRILWLYNDILKKRISFIQHAKKKIIYKRNHNLYEIEYDIINSIMELVKKIKPLAKLCAYLGLAKSKCIVCDEKNNDFIKCDYCDIVYCYQCYLDVNETCLLCNED